MRDPDEAHRAATPLELLFDLCFVVAIAQAATGLHHAIGDGHAWQGFQYFALSFFAIWWAWMNFTWFASSYDNDSITFRLLTFVQIAGVLVLAAGIPSSMRGEDFTVVTIGYAIMRVGLITQWLRAAHDDPEGRRTALRYAVGLTIVQCFWLARLPLVQETADWATPTFLLLVLAEFTVPVWAERVRKTGWHPGHIAERYGLLTLIVLGETVLAATVALEAADADGAVASDLIMLGLGALATLFAMWWWYFDVEAANGLRRGPNVPFIWGYLHYFVFAASAAYGAGVAVVVDATSGGHAGYGHVGQALSVAIPLAVFTLAVGAVQNVARPDAAIHFSVPIMAAGAIITLAGAVGYFSVIGAVASFCVPIIVLVVAGRVRWKHGHDHGHAAARSGT